MLPKENIHSKISNHHYKIQKIILKVLEMNRISVFQIQKIIVRN